MRISFLIHNAYGIGGTIRTTFNLAGALAERHDVEIVSVFRHRNTPLFAYDPRVRLRHLVDLRKNSSTYEGEHPEALLPAKVFPAGDHRWKQYSALTDERIGRALAELDTDVVIGTRPGLNVHIARQAPSSLVRIGQEHLTFDTHPTRLTLTLRRLYPGLDAITTTTEADAAVYRRKMRLPGVRITAVPNSVPLPDVAPSDCTAPYVVAAGRLSPVKRYQDLIRAFAKVSAARPDWSLRLYGGGDQKEKLAALVDQLGLHDSVTLMGRAAPIEPEMAKGSILAVSSRMESFGMTIVEAMRVGLPVVSTDCPLGPGEIIEHGTDGLLVPLQNPDAMADALLQLINDDERRKAMGRAALVMSERFDPERVARQCEDLFQELLDARGGAGGRAHSLRRRTTGLAMEAAYTGKDLAKAVLGGTGGPAGRIKRRLRK